MGTSVHSTYDGSIHCLPDVDHSDVAYALEWHIHACVFNSPVPPLNSSAARHASNVVLVLEEEEDHPFVIIKISFLPERRVTVANPCCPVIEGSTNVDALSPASVPAAQGNGSGLLCMVCVCVCVWPGGVLKKYQKRQFIELESSLVYEEEEKK